MNFLSLIFRTHLEYWCPGTGSHRNCSTEFTKFQSVCVYNAICELIFKPWESKVPRCYPSLRFVKGLPADLVHDVHLCWSWTVRCHRSERQTHDRITKWLQGAASSGSWSDFLSEKLPGRTWAKKTLQPCCSSCYYRNDNTFVLEYYSTPSRPIRRENPAASGFYHTVDLLHHIFIIIIFSYSSSYFEHFADHFPLTAHVCDVLLLTRSRKDISSRCFDPLIDPDAFILTDHSLVKSHVFPADLCVSARFASDFFPAAKKVVLNGGVINNLICARHGKIWKANKAGAAEY